MIRASVEQGQIQKDKVLKKKKQAEKRLYKKFRSWQRKVYNNFIGQMKQGAQMVMVDADHKRMLNELLTEHYYYVSRKFVPGIFKEQKSISGTPIDGSPEETPQYLDYLLPGVILAIENSIEDIIKYQKPTHFDSIISTTNRIGNESASIARATEGKYSTILANKLASKTSTVATTETTWISEGSQSAALGQTTPILPQADPRQLKDLQKISPNVTLKNIDVENFFLQSQSYRESAYEVLTSPEKVWISMGDGRVRESHAREDGTRVRVNEAFVLPGGRLMYPGDTSLGVELGEIYNCRCWAMYR